MVMEVDRRPLHEQLESEQIVFDISLAPKKVSYYKVRNAGKKLKVLWAEGSHICHICLTEIQELSGANLDHIVPYAGGGSRKIENLLMAHKSCNHRRGNVSIALTYQIRDEVIRLYADEKDLFRRQKIIRGLKWAIKKQPWEVIHEMLLSKEDIPYPK